MSLSQIPKHLQFSQKQLFGAQQPNQHIQQQDIINQIQFDPTGDLLAIGDNAGRIILFKQQDDEFGDQKSFQYYAQFQSHEPQFDSLKSLHMSESITQIKWLRPQANYNKLVTSNKNTIKLWKTFQKSNSFIQSSSFNSICLNQDSPLLFPTLNKKNEFTSKAQVTFPIRHQGNINKVEVAQNEQYLISTDQHTAICWNFQDFDHPFIIEDTKSKKNWKEGQKIACSKLHPHSDNIFTIGTNYGTVELNDLRTSFNNRKNTQFLSSKQNQKDNDYFINMSKRINSLQFLSHGRYVVARDYLTVKVWDVCRPTQPLSVVEINPQLHQKMCTLFENQCMEDNFSVSSFCQNLIVTGSYDNRFHIIDPLGYKNAEFQMNFNAKNAQKSMIDEESKTLQNHFDTDKKVLACGVHNKSKKIALSTLNSFFIYSPSPQGQNLQEIEL